MLRFEFHRRPLSLMLVRERPNARRGKLRWDRGIGLRVGYFPDHGGGHGVRLLLWATSVRLACWRPRFSVLPRVSLSVTPPFGHLTWRCHADGGRKLVWE